MTTRPAVEVVAVEWVWKERESALRGRPPTERFRARIAWIDVLCHVCGRSFRAEKTDAPGKAGFFPLIYHVTIACECGALVGMKTDDLAHFDRAERGERVWRSDAE